MLAGLSASLTTGTIAATGTLGRYKAAIRSLVPLGDVLLYQQGAIEYSGIFAPKSVSWWSAPRH